MDSPRDNIAVKLRPISVAVLQYYPAKLYDVSKWAKSASCYGGWQYTAVFTHNTMFFFSFELLKNKNCFTKTLP